MVKVEYKTNDKVSEDCENCKEVHIVKLIYDKHMANKHSGDLLSCVFCGESLSVSSDMN